MTHKKDIEQYGRSFAPKCEFEIHNDDAEWGATVVIGRFYYETDLYKYKQEAIAEQRGCLLAIKEQIEKYLATIKSI